MNLRSQGVKPDDGQQGIEHCGDLWVSHWSPAGKSLNSQANKVPSPEDISQPSSSSTWLCPQHGRGGDQQGPWAPAMTLLDSDAVWRAGYLDTQAILLSCWDLKVRCHSSWHYLPWLIGLISKLPGIFLYRAQISIISSQQKDNKTLELCSKRGTPSIPKRHMITSPFLFSQDIN